MTANSDGNGTGELSREARDVSILAQAFQKMAEQAERLAGDGESNAIRCMAAGEALAWKMAAFRIRQIVNSTVVRPIEIDTDALVVMYDSHIKMLEGFLETQGIKIQQEVGDGPGSETE